MMMIMIMTIEMVPETMVGPFQPNQLTRQTAWDFINLAAAKASNLACPSFGSKFVLLFILFQSCVQTEIRCEHKSARQHF
jgi:hypothetical protein